MASDIGCIICYSDTYTSDNIVNICMLADDIHSIKKKCACRFKVHEECLLTWINKKPVCPYCRQPILIKPQFHNFTVIKSRCKCNTHKLQAFVTIGLIGFMTTILIISTR
jgi:hypothetical protein